MPVTFAQPSPVSAFHGSVDPGVFAQMQGILQQRYAADADRQMRSQLGFAQLSDERSQRQNELGLRASEIAMRPALQQQAADLQLNNWMTQQRFTQQDQMDLARQETVTSELQDKFDKGEISQSELYQMLGKVAPRVNFLKAKEQHSRNKAMEEMRQQQAAEFKSRKDMHDNLLAFQQAEVDGKLDYHIPPQYRVELANTMQFAHPDLRAGTSEYSEMEKAEANKNGWAVRALKKADGSIVMDPRHTGMLGMPGAGGAAGTGAGGAGGELGGAKEADILRHVTESTNKHFESLGKTPSADEWKAYAKTQASGIAELQGLLRGQPTQEMRQQAEGEYKGVAADLDNKEALIRSSTNLGPGAKMIADRTIGELRRIHAAYPPSKQMPASVADRVRGLKSKLDQVIYNVQAQPQGGQQGQPDQPQPAGPAPGEPTEVWLHRFTQDLGNIGRRVGKGIREDLKRADNPFPDTTKSIGDTMRAIGDYFAGS
jgi:hypothetical protein